MRRVSRGKQKKSETASDGEEELSGSVRAENDETESEKMETSNSAAKKRSAKSRAKTNDDTNHEDDVEEASQENGKSPTKRRKKENEENDSDGENKRSSKKGKGKQDKDSDINHDNVEENGKAVTKNKRKSKTVEKEPDNDDGEEYEVEKIVDQRTIKGRRQFLVRWKGYTEESDTWEQEKELNCDRLIEEFLAEQENNDTFTKDEEKSEKKTKAKKQDTKSQKKQKKPSKGKNDVSKDTKDKEGKDDEKDASEDESDQKEYEVEKIIEVHFKKNKKREFLIRWKGFSSNADTWEPEEHLNCPELINKFMEKLEKIKSTDSRELRVNPSHTKRYTLTMHSNNKRHSRRYADKQRSSNV